jgi:hypothetical protein
MAIGSACAAPSSQSIGQNREAVSFTLARFHAF